MTNYRELLTGKEIEYDGDTWEIIGVGVTKDDANTTYCHLKSKTRGFQQKNGFNPVQMCHDIPHSVLFHDGVNYSSGC